MTKLVATILFTKGFGCEKFLSSYVLSFVLSFCGGCLTKSSSGINWSVNCCVWFLFDLDFEHLKTVLRKMSLIWLAFRVARLSTLNSWSFFVYSNIPLLFG